MALSEFESHETQPTAPAAAGRRAPRLDRLVRIWIVPVLLVLVAATSFVYERQPGDARASTLPSACQASDWKTTVTLDQSRPELAATTLRSRNEIGQTSARTCVEVSLACLRDGPYFEIRLASPTLAIRQVGPLEIRSLNDELAAQVFSPTAGGENAVRLADKPAVELIAYALANSIAFRVPIALSNGDTGLAEFKSYHFSSAVRPVLFACNMRSLQEEPPDESDNSE